MPQMNMIQALNSAMDIMLGRDPNVVILGEDVGYFGGVFRVTDGLQRKYGEHRVLDTPIAEGAIVGAATYGMGQAPGLGSMDIAVHASLRALAQAQLTPKDVDGVFVALPDDFLSGLSLSEYLGIQPRITDNNRTGGSSFQTYVLMAALALAAGQCNVALIAYGSNQRSGAGKLVSGMKASVSSEARHR